MEMEMVPNSPQAAFPNAQNSRRAAKNSLQARESGSRYHHGKVQPHPEEVSASFFVSIWGIDLKFSACSVFALSSKYRLLDLKEHSIKIIDYTARNIPHQLSATLMATMADNTH